MSQNFARFVGQFEIQNPIILDSFKFSVPLLTQPVGIVLVLLTYKRAECCPYAGFFAVNMRWTAIYNSMELKGKFPLVT